LRDKGRVSLIDKKIWQQKRKSQSESQLSEKSQSESQLSEKSQSESQLSERNKLN